MRSLIAVMLLMPIGHVAAQAPQTITPQEWLARAQRSVAELKDNEPEQKGRQLALLAESQARHGDNRGAAQSMAAAKLLAGKIEPVDARGVFLGTLAAYQTATGDISGAFDTAELIGQLPDRQAEELKYRAWRQIALGQARRGDFQAALDNVDLAKGDELTQDFAWDSIASLQAKAGKIDDALRTAARVRSPRVRLNTYATLAKELHARKHAAAKQCLRHALDARQAIPDERGKTLAEFQVLDAKAAMGEIQEALRAAKESRNEYSFSVIARAQAAAGDWDGALATARLIATENTRDFALGAIVEAAPFAKGRTVLRRFSFEKVESLVAEVKYDWVKATIWTKAGERFAANGDAQDARRAFAQARSLVDKITAPPGVIHARFSALRTLAAALSSAGFLVDAKSLADAQKEPVYRSTVLIGILEGLPQK